MSKTCFSATVVFLLLIATQSAVAAVSQAVTFASQAGVVAGAAQACGQSIGVMTARTNEAISALSIDSADINNAMGAYQRAVSDSAASQALSQQLTCSKVVSDFNNLPILQADYKQTVIAQFTRPNPQQANTNGAAPVQTAPAYQTTQTSMQPAMTSASTPAYSASTAAAAFPVDNSQTTSQVTQQAVPNQQVVTANGAPVTSAMALDQQNAANAAAKLKLAQQLADMAQGLVATTTPAAQQQNIPYPEQNPAFTQYQTSAINPDNAHNGTNNPAFNVPLGVQPYPPGTNMNNATGLIGEPSTSSYPPSTTQNATTIQSVAPTPYGP